MDFELHERQSTERLWHELAVVVNADFDSWRESVEGRCFQLSVYNVPWWVAGNELSDEVVPTAVGVSTGRHLPEFVNLRLPGWIYAQGLQELSKRRSKELISIGFEIEAAVTPARRRAAR